MRALRRIFNKIENLLYIIWKLGIPTNVQTPIFWASRANTHTSVSVPDFIRSSYMHSI